MEKKDGNCTRMVQAVLNKSKKQLPTKQQLYGHLPPISRTIQIRQIRHTGQCWRCKDGLINDVLPWTLSHWRASRTIRIYQQQLCTDRGCSLEDLPEVMDDRDWWRERGRQRERERGGVREIRASSTTLWWGWFMVSLCLSTIARNYE